MSRGTPRVSQDVRSAQLRLKVLTCATAPEGSGAPMPRALVVIAHPDDEIIALGARLGRYRDAVFVHVTDGAPRDGGDAAAHGFRSLAEYHAARRAEFATALRLAGIADADAREIGVADQQAALHLCALTQSLRALVAELQPEVVLTHPYEGGHPDHDACAYAVQLACALPGAATLVRTPVRVEAAFYHQGSQGIETGCFLPGSLPSDDGGAVSDRALSAAEQTRKEALFACFPSQAETLKWFPRDRELFRLAPEYDFTQPPHSGAVFYEQFPWGMTAARFCELAGEAAAQLQPECAPCR